MNTEISPLFKSNDKENLQLFCAVKKGEVVAHFVVPHDEYASATGYLAQHPLDVEWDYVRSATMDEFIELLGERTASAATPS